MDVPIPALMVDTESEPFEDPLEADDEPLEAPPSPDYMLASPDYAPALDDDTKLVEALALPDYSLGSDTESELSEVDSEESVGEDASDEDHSDDDIPKAVVPPPAQVTSTPHAEPTPAPQVTSYRGTRVTVRKTVCPQPALSAALQAAITHHHQEHHHHQDHHHLYQLDHSVGAIAPATPSLSSLLADLLPPHKMFRAYLAERLESVELEVETLRSRLASADMEIAAL
ncbi:hypothetical protein Tco_1097627 [Tanacetum coccineum]